MNQPTREEFEQLKEEVRILKQQTEPMKVTRIELDPGGIQNRLDNHAELMKEMSSELKEQGKLLQVVFNQSGTQATDIGTLKQTAERLEQKMSDGFQTMEKRLDAIAEVQKLILDRLPKTEGE